MTACEEVRIRRMTVADLDRGMEIAAGLKEAPHWARAAYLAAIDPAGAPRRIALVAESGSLAGFAVASVVIGETGDRQRRGTTNQHRLPRPNPLDPPGKRRRYVNLGARGSLARPMNGLARAQERL